ncbi:MAG: phosphoribosylformylglycinamidine synthase I [Chitinophagaceae bacterium]|nr:phosphoribosylformylglycinamidine synthase I [Chitinophagaceae bacterium]MCZ2397743.1 phosphoribosylformylglycinamidine synthase I [Chitinophagales bacterium]
MKFGVVVFPGSNCDRDMVDALTGLGYQVDTIWHKDSSLAGFSPEEDCIVLPGGFSFGDYLRCGSIARFSPVMIAITEFARQGGRVLGICNGFQILCESGLLPGVLLQNTNVKFICKNAWIKSERSGVVYKIPIAHGEGQYYIDTDGLEELRRDGQVLYRYCNEAGEVRPEFAPNGSLDGIAGICNKEGNVVGMMPHPERASSVFLKNEDGVGILEELFELVAKP